MYYNNLLKTTTTTTTMAVSISIMRHHNHQLLKSDWQEWISISFPHCFRIHFWPHSYGSKIHKQTMPCLEILIDIWTILTAHSNSTTSLMEQSKGYFCFSTFSQRKHRELAGTDKLHGYLNLCLLWGLH